MKIQSVRGVASEQRQWIAYGQRHVSKLWSGEGDETGERCEIGLLTDDYYPASCEAQGPEPTKRQVKTVLPG